MRTYTYIGYFREGISPITVDCLGFYQAYFLITAKAIKGGIDYTSLHRIVDENSKSAQVKEEVNPFKTPL